ncbi:hypothetical protein [Desulfosporosinus sp.]|uniref:hypothetical protein n=1 Tax=Desulfosporosinus sp. TaxID=157907 RepID=UPI0026081FDB|nr:hypothetical protein [Desulfosporosinus sp.]
MGECSCQPLAKSKGVHREVESEGSWRQSPDPRNTNINRHIRLDEFAIQNEVPKLHGNRSVNDAGTWDEGYLSYHGRSHRRVETQYEARLKKIYCEKSAEAIVAEGTSHQREVEDSQTQ